MGRLRPRESLLRVGQLLRAEGAVASGGPPDPPSRPVLPFHVDYVHDSASRDFLGQSLALLLEKELVFWYFEF